MRAPASLAWRAILLSVVAHATVLAEGESLHALIDERMAPLSGVTSPSCSDAEFLRRVSLDLIGMPPTADEARQFLADTSADKRVRLIDRLFASPHYPRHMAHALDVMLMERRANTHIAADAWLAYLVKSVRDNKPWHVLAREILTASGDNAEQRPAARFVLDRASDPNMLTRDVGRIFFGRDMQCAQCHDHPLVVDYLQSDYQGLLAFFTASYALARTVNGAAITVQAEKPGSDITFQSVFVGTPRRTGARAPDCIMIEEPFLLPGDDYAVALADNALPVPKASRREKLAELATNGSNAAFNRNIANRLWGHMFGRGLVHPPDMQHPNNPATDPELLNLLADRFAAMNFDIRNFLREIALSGAYQRSFDIPAGVFTLSTQANVEIEKFQAQHAALEQASTTSEDAYSKASDVWQEKESAMMPAAAELDAARTKYAETKASHEAALKAVADATAAQTAKQALATPVETAAAAAAAALKTIPEDTKLAESSQRISAKAAQLGAEVVALAKVVDEKTAAVKPAADALAAAKAAAAAANAKAAPLIAAMREAEQPMLEARRKVSKDLETLAAVDRKLETAKQIAKLPEVNNVVVAAAKAVESRQAEVAAAEKHLNEFAAIVAEQEQKSKATADAVTAAAAARDAARAEHDQWTQAASAMSAATAANAAWHDRSHFLVVSSASAELFASAAAARQQLGESQQQCDATTAACTAADQAFVATQETLAAALAERVRREQSLEAARANLSAAQSEAAAKQSELDKFVGELTERWTTDFTVASLKPLSPEQLCWTVFRVTGVYERHWQAEVAALDKAKPLTEEQKKDAAQLAAREVELEQLTFDKLKANIPIFVGFYGAAAGQPQGDFFSTADQALFAANGGAINSWVAPAAANVTEKVAQHEDPKAAAEELYLTLLTRLPSEGEASEVVSHLTNHKENKPVAAQELVWALLNSAEFRFNH